MSITYGHDEKDYNNTRYISAEYITNEEYTAMKKKYYNEIQFSELSDLDIMCEILHDLGNGLGKIIERSNERMSSSCHKRAPAQIPLQSRPQLSPEEHRRAEEKLRLEDRLKEIEERLSMLENKKWYHFF